MTLRSEVEKLHYRPIISVITPVHNTPPDVLSACMKSVAAQAYTNWQHCLADDGSTPAERRLFFASTRTIRASGS